MMPDTLLIDYIGFTQELGLLLSEVYFISLTTYLLLSSSPNLIWVIVPFIDSSILKRKDLSCCSMLFSDRGISCLIFFVICQKPYRSVLILERHLCELVH